MRPIYSITIGSSKFSNEKNMSGGLLGVNISSGLDSVNESVVLVSVDSGKSISLGDQVTILLGHSKPVLVFTGVVQEIKSRTEYFAVQATSQFVKFTTYRSNRVYEQRTSGNMIKEIADELGVNHGIIEEGIEYPVHTMGDDRTIFEHIQLLTHYNGFHFYADEKDRLMLTSETGKNLHQFGFGKNILHWQLSEEGHDITGVKVYGESPISLGQGNESYSWLAAKEVAGVAGNAEGTSLDLVEPSLKSINAAEEVARYQLARLKRKRIARLKIPGNSSVKLLDLFKMTGIPEKKDLPTYQCTGIKHQFEKRLGFITHLTGKEVVDG